MGTLECTRHFRPDEWLSKPETIDTAELVRALIESARQDVVHSRNRWLARQNRRAKHRKSLNLAGLEEAARSGNEAVFLDILKAMDWQYGAATDFIKALDLSLEVGAHLAARHLATQGAEIHPDNAELQKYARVLAPPRVVANRSPRAVKIAANVEWLNANKDDYKGKWVAVKDGTLIVAADSHKELIDQIGETKGSGILVTPIY